MDIICKRCKKRFSSEVTAAKRLTFHQCRQLFSIDIAKAGLANCPHCGLQQSTKERAYKPVARKLPEIGASQTQTTDPYSESERIYLETKDSYKGDGKTERIVNRTEVTTNKRRLADLQKPSGSKRGLLGVMILTSILVSGLYRLIMPVASVDSTAGAAMASVQEANLLPQFSTTKLVTSNVTTDTATRGDAPELHGLENRGPDAWMEYIATYLDVDKTIREGLLPKGAHLSSSFGYRVDPFMKTWKFHHGLDIAMKYGTPVKSVLPGKIVFAGYAKNYGRVVFVEHPFGLVTVYGHLSKIFVQEGEEIIQHEMIGSVGMTGRATGPHLHFEMRRHNKTLDPTMIPQFNFLAKGKKSSTKIKKTIAG